MKKWIALILAAAMLLALSACGGTAEADTASAPETASEGSASVVEESSAPESGASAAQEIAAAENGTLKFASANAAIVVKGTAVPMPYRFSELVSAGVPADDSIKEISLGAGDFFSPNLFLDENEDYVIIPAYYNGTDNALTVAEAEAGEITMATYASEPQDQDVSLLGVKFGMTRSEVTALLGEAAYEEDDALQWTVELTDGSQAGSFSVLFTSGADDAVVMQAVLSLAESF
ncbi:MAG: hypothetical protein Q3977_01425 [Oscillospiraceae bacterium]|nr:hypothetical protein [Oscillospiraceae bacterium]